MLQGGWPVGKYEWDMTEIDCFELDCILHVLAHGLTELSHSYRL